MLLLVMWSRIVGWQTGGNGGFVIQRKGLIGNVEDLKRRLFRSDQFQNSMNIFGDEGVDAWIPRTASNKCDFQVGHLVNEVKW